VPLEGRIRPRQDFLRCRWGGEKDEQGKNEWCRESISCHVVLQGGSIFA
jgi:hypothetical protein